MAKRNHNTFHLRSDAIFLQQSPFLSLQLLWCFIPPCYFFCYLMLVQNPQQWDQSLPLRINSMYAFFHRPILSLLAGTVFPKKICHFHNVTKSSVYSSIEITFQVFSGIVDINYLISYRQSIKLRVSPATCPEGNLLNRHITTLSNIDLSWHNKPTDKNSYNASACINISSYS